MHDSFKALMPLIIPEGVSDYFEMPHYSKEDKRLDIFLEELNNTPEEYQGQKLVSKGFFAPITLQDFPIRGMQVYLHVKRREFPTLQQDNNNKSDWNYLVLNVAS